MYDVRILSGAGSSAEVVKCVDSVDRPAFEAHSTSYQLGDLGQMTISLLLDYPHLPKGDNNNTYNIILFWGLSSECQVLCITPGPW